MAFVVFVGGAVLAWRTLGVADTGHPAGPSGGTDAGYHVQFPDSIESADRIEAVTNLPEGTLFEERSEIFGPTAASSESEGFGCCTKVQDGRIVVKVENSTCYNHVGATADSSGFSVGITVRPTFDDFQPSIPAGGTWEPPTQPAAVFAVLGRHFENVTGDQVVTFDDGTRQLVATARYAWPGPQCGGDPLPLFGGPDCPPQPEQLQGDDIKEAMGEIMGAISQARMCEFWGTELPPDVEAQRPWPEFAKQWRDWFLNPPKDFSDAKSDAYWDLEPFTWHLVRQQGDRHFVDIADHGQVIISLEIDALPDYCPDCDPGVVPFWGVVDWTLH